MRCGNDFMKTKDQNPRRIDALRVLEHLLRHLKSITADILYVALRDADFSEDECVRFTGAILRTAKARGWSERTDFSVKSKRNHSNLHSVWLSRIQGKKHNGKPIAEESIKREYSKWNRAGYNVPDHLAITWKTSMKYANDCDVSFQQPPADSYYGATVMHR